MSNIRPAADGEQARVRLLRASSHKRMPWANGGGSTYEIHRAGDSAQWDWRLSIANVDVPGPFSVLPGIDRCITVISGAGMQLTWAEGIFDLLPGCVHEFPGERAISCRLIESGTRDLNLMLRRGVASGAIELQCVAGFAQIQGARAIVVLGGALLHETAMLGAEDVLLADSDPPALIQLHGNGDIACIRVQLAQL